MDREAIKCNHLEQMLVDANKEPTDLPLSLLEALTNNFAEDHIIGRGGFAVVYKGLLQNGLVAVKKLSQVVDMDEKNFNQEVRSLIRVKHKNIVRFLGYCADTQGKLEKYGTMTVMADIRQRLLCFEFIPNGGLDKHINDASGGLEWRTRYQIIKGICEGLHHLHQQNIVHLDLKPANILMDCNMVPKIADFGLSKCFDEDQTRAITLKVIGTLGYMAPEFFSGVITFKSDIYSLGIIISEMLTGQKGYFQIENVLKSWSARFLTSQKDMWLEYVRACAEIGLKCMNSNPVKRPMTKDILQTFDELETRVHPPHLLEKLDELECSFMQNDPSATYQVHPLLVLFDWDADRCIEYECPVTLINKTDQYVGVWITPTSLDTWSGLEGFPYLWEPQSSKDEKRSTTLFRRLRPHSSMVIFMTTRREKQPLALQRHKGMFDVVMFTTKCWWTDLQDLELHLTNIKDIKSENSWKRIKDLGTEVYRETLRVVDEPAAICKSAVMTRQFIRANQNSGDIQIQCIDVHPRETWVLVGHLRGYASIWNYETKDRVRVFQIIDCRNRHGLWLFASRICSTKFIAGEQWFAAGDGSGSIHVYSYTNRNWAKVKEFEAHCGKTVDMLDVHPTDSFLLTASRQDKLIKLWDWRHGWTCVRVFGAQDVSHLTVGPRDTNTFASSSSEGVKVWDFHSPDPIATFRCYKQPVFYTDNHRHFLTALFHSYSYCEVKTWDLHTKKEVHRLVTSSLSIDMVARHPTLPKLASIRGKSTFLWDTNSYRLLKRFELPNDYIAGMVINGTVDFIRIMVGSSEGISIFEVDLSGQLTAGGK